MLGGPRVPSRPCIDAPQNGLFCLAFILCLKHWKSENPFSESFS